MLTVCKNSLFNWIFPVAQRCGGRTSVCSAVLSSAVRSSSSKLPSGFVSSSCKMYSRNSVLSIWPSPSCTACSKAQTIRRSASPRSILVLRSAINHSITSLRGHRHPAPRSFFESTELQTQCFATLSRTCAESRGCQQALARLPVATTPKQFHYELTIVMASPYRRCARGRSSSTRAGPGRSPSLRRHRAIDC